MGSNTPKTNRLDETTADQKLVDGLTKHASTITALVIGGVSVSTADIITTVKARITASAAVGPARATWQAAVAAEDAERAKTKQFVAALRQALLVAFAGQIDTLADFGLTQRKARVMSPDAKVAAAKKAALTRAARHTMGKKQKADITGANPTGAPAGSPAVSPPVAAAPAQTVTSAPPVQASPPSPAPVAPAVSPASPPVTSTTEPTPTKS